MAEETPQNGAIHFQCVCEEELQIAPELLGRTFPCPHCGRYLRPGLQFLMVEQNVAPNLAAVCSCGRFIIERPARAGKTVKCKMCGQRMVMPRPVERKNGKKLVRFSQRALEKRISRARRTRGPGGTAGGTRRSRLPRTGRISLRPGQEVCVNEECGLPLPPGGNVCPRCGVNLKTGVRYEGPGPEADPRGKWRKV